ncbi:MAG: hypothetical protein JWM95_1727 [Gemmatimonadetes bacterium]|nr:hypothetical protein [Gemmatimonadota bacterium]
MSALEAGRENKLKAIANDPEVWRRGSWECIRAEIEAAAERHDMPIRVALEPARLIQESAPHGE